MSISRLAIACAKAHRGVVVRCEDAAGPEGPWGLADSNATGLAVERYCNSCMIFGYMGGVQENQAFVAV